LLSGDHEDRRYETLGGDELMTDPTPNGATDAAADASASQAVNAHDLLVLARVAGLPISDDRAAGLASEFANTLMAVRELDVLLADQPILTSHAFSPYDPAWSGESTGGTGAGR